MLTPICSSPARSQSEGTDKENISRAVTPTCQDGPDKTTANSQTSTRKSLPVPEDEHRVEGWSTVSLLLKVVRFARSAHGSRIGGSSSTQASVQKFLQSHFQAFAQAVPPSRVLSSLPSNLEKACPSPSPLTLTACVVPMLVLC